MDVAYNQHASHVRRKNRSTTNLNSLSLAPLTTKLPLDDLNTNIDDFPDPKSAPLRYSTSYLQGKSAPTTPRLLSRSPGPYKSRSPSHTRGASTPAAGLPKSKSTTHLQHPSSRPQHASGHGHRRKRGNGSNGGHDELAVTDTDWVLRTGALMWTETRESKGQAWLLSRASSTSLAGSADDEEKVDETVLELLARERGYASRHASRRGSLDPVSAIGDEHVHVSSPSASRLGSRSQSRVGSVRGNLLTPTERRSIDGYFPHQHHHNQLEEDVEEEDYVAGPDFVNLDEKLEAVEEVMSDADEAHVRRLVKNGGAGAGTWLGNVLGNWGLSSVEEHEEESDAEAEDETTPPEDHGESEDGRFSVQQPRRRSTLRQFEGATVPVEELIPPPKADEGGWQDAAWLLSVASKVLL